MLRSMYAGISGMRGFQTKLDTVSNNIANVNTFGFKKGRVTFQDQLSQTVQGAQAPQRDEAGNAMLGGRNAKQIGLGTTLGSVDTIHTEGSRQTTNRSLDLALGGNGMFVVGEKTTTPAEEDVMSLDEDAINFTRAGNFYLDEEGYVVTSDGKYLLGRSNLDDNNQIQPGDTLNDLDEEVTRLRIPVDAQGFSISPDGTVNMVDSNGQSKIAGQVMLATFSNAEGLEKAGSNLYRLTNNSGVFTDDDGDFNGFGDLVYPGRNGSASIYAGALEMSNVDLAEEFTEMITSQRGFQANTRTITTSDEILQELVNLKR
ncbi:flagellar basal body rod protein FlgG [Salirhabdus salicampi]|uniref:flagellar basal body rod protein FlgG n=1 Tax=Salirhabdus salicampi TaxID=476102 RepID=UPI0020C57971|nr:flagellar basal body rod protein FlgG [Salirhabdus salicampi]MCP8616516.1 flagellar basal body rod protein FlgG [Salirhabdus salicampi]